MQDFCEKYGTGAIDFEYIIRVAALIQDLRIQCKLFENSETYFALYSILSVFFLLLIGIFISVEIVVQGFYEVSHVAIVGAFLIFVFIKLILKIVVAARITEEVSVLHHAYVST